MIFMDEGSNNILLCEKHANKVWHSSDSIQFEIELKKNKLAINELERKLIFTQKQIAKIRSISSNENIYNFSGILTDLEK